MQVEMQQVDAFASEPFRGNPAAVVQLTEWLDDAVLQGIALENNLSETAFLVPREPPHFDLRWFTPTVEVDLCGHATLASGFVVLSDSDSFEHVVFHTRSGPLEVRRHQDMLQMSFPAIPVLPGEVPPEVLEALGSAPLAAHPVRRVHHANYALAVYETVADIVALAPDVHRLGALDHNVICTAAGGDGVDFVSRFFAPASGVAEDPVTGSAHCTLAPYWAAELGRNPLRAAQLSRRGGELECEVEGDRVLLRGSCVRVLSGTLFL
ncbi:MAG: PhzF family phenazine biosynthesis protein [Myxococcales bacterium]|nr:PhzF family phenazine biosynthesis protein [Myxococcales bacterium]